MHVQVKEGRLFVTFPGDVLSTSAAAWRAQWAEVTKPGEGPLWTVVELDLRAAKMIDSSGLALVQSAVRDAKGRGASVTLRIASKTVHRILLFARLDAEIVVEAAT